MDHNNHPDKTFFPKNISTVQAVDTGMAMVLIALLVSFTIPGKTPVYVALALLLLNMVVPRCYVPIAKLWLGLATVMGTFMSKVIMSIIFFCVVCPIALIRRLIGGDNLQLKKWKTDNKSVFSIKSYTYSSNDIQKPY